MMRTITRLSRRAGAAGALLAAVLTAMATPRAMGQVELPDGAVIPKDRFIFYIFLGHSNMDGRARKKDHPRHPRAWQYDTGAEKWVEASDDGSPKIHFLNKMCEEFPEYHIGAVKRGISGASIEGQFRKGKSGYNTLAKASRSAMKTATAGGVLAMVGFCEAGNRSSAERYLDNVKGMMTEFRQDLVNPELPLLMGKFEEQARDRRACKEIVIEAISKIPEVIPRAVVIDRDGPYIDGHHYTAEGHRIWAHEGVRLIKEHRLFPFAPPVSVRLTSPTENQLFDAGAEIAVEADATSEEGTVRGVEFFADGKRIGRAGSKPYRLTWKGAGEGIHRLRARAFDDQGNDANSSYVTVAAGDVPRVLFVGGSIGLGEAELKIKRRIEDMGYLVVVANDDEITPEAAEGMAAVLIPASCHGLAVRKFATVPAPVMIWNDFCPELRVVDLGGGAITAGDDTLEVPESDHPLTAGLSGKVKVFERPLPVRWGQVLTHAKVGAALPGSPAKAAVFGYESGSTLPRMQTRAPNRRVSMFMGYYAVNHFTGAGWELFDAALQWALEGKPAAAMTADELARAQRIYDAWPANTDGLVYLWENAEKPNRVLAADGRNTRECKVAPRGRATFGRLYDMNVTGGSFVAEPEEVNEALLTACKASNAFTVEALLTPAEGPQTGPARIVGFSSGNANCNFALCQHLDALALKIRTNGTGRGGAMAGLCKLPAGKPSHVVLTVYPGMIRCYVDGKATKPYYTFQGNFSTWSPQRLIFGDEWDGGCDWKGRIEGLAIYARGMELKEVEDRYKLYAERLADRKPPQRLVLEGKLLARSKPTDPPSEYRRCLIVNQYKVEKVLAGTCQAEKVQVAHWATLGGEYLPEIVQRKVGRTYKLTLEPWAAHPQLKTEQRNNDHEADALDLPLYYDVRRGGDRQATGR